MNHATITASALQYRRRTLQLDDKHSFDIERAAEIAVVCGDPEIDRAIRVIGTAWCRAGLAPESIGDEWTEAAGACLMDSGGFEVIDALDVIVRQVSLRAVCSSSHRG